MRPRVERVVAEPGDFRFHAAHVGDDCTEFDVRRDLTDERHNLIDGPGDDHELGAAHGSGGSFSN